MTTPTPLSQLPVSRLNELLQAILAGLQIAFQALPVITAYQQTFSHSGAHLAAPIVQQAAELHPVTGAVVATLLAPPPPVQ